jgi:hypothetical protein
MKGDIQTIQKNANNSLLLSGIIIPPDPAMADDKRAKLFRDYLGTPEDYLVTHLTQHREKRVYLGGKITSC